MLLDLIVNPFGFLQVKNYARMADSIIGWGSSIGQWARIENKSVIGEDVHVRVHQQLPPFAICLQKHAASLTLPWQECKAQYHQLKDSQTIHATLLC